MGFVDSEERLRRRVGMAWDMGLPLGLLAALLAVLSVDRMRTRETGVDLVFIVDQGPSMANQIDWIKTVCSEKAGEYAAKGLKCRFAIVPFSGDADRIPAIAFTPDLAEFQKRLNEPAPSASSRPATAALALEQAAALDFRVGADPLFFLISETPFGNPDEATEAARKLREKRVTAIVQASAAARESCLPLFANGGKFFSLEGQDLTGSAPPRPAEEIAADSSRSPNLLSSGETDSKPELPGKMKGIYILRTTPDRPKYVKKVGGSDKSEQAVQDGLAWLARHQSRDGSWSDAGRCELGQKCPRLKYTSFDAVIAETGLAVLAFQAGGHYDFNDQKYSENVKRGLDWLITQQSRRNKQSTVYYWYEHGIATFAMAEACALARAHEHEPEPRYLDGATRAVKFIEDHQYARGGWQYAIDSAGNGDTSVTGWQVLALKSAMEAKIPLSRRAKTMPRVRSFFEALGNPQTGRTSYQFPGDGGTNLTTAVGLVMQGFVFGQPNSPLARQAAQRLSEQAETLGRSGDFYTLYNGSLGMFVVRGQAWDTWNRGVRDAVIARQETQGCSRGSWNHASNIGFGPYGQTLDTAWALLTLQVYYRYAPKSEDDAPKSEDDAPKSEDDAEKKEEAVPKTDADEESGGGDQAKP